MDYHFTFQKKEKNRGHCTNYLSGGPNLTPSPQISRIIQYKTLRSELFRHLYITYYLHEVNQHSNAKKKKKKQCMIGVHAGIDPVPLVPQSDTLTTRLREITVHIGQII